MSRTKLFFDLDGTLIDSTQRLYHLFQKMVPISTFSYEEYWKLKRTRQTHADLLRNHFNYSEENIQGFEKQWLDSIEQNEWLDYDRPFPGVTAYLEQLQAGHELYLVTSRQLPASATRQIGSFGWLPIFKKILVADPPKEKAAVINAETIISANDWIIGDTEKDIETGKKLGMKTAAVLSGFRGRTVLEKYKPDIIVNSVTELEF